LRAKPGKTGDGLTLPALVIVEALNSTCRQIWHTCRPQAESPAMTDTPTDPILSEFGAQGYSHPLRVADLPTRKPTHFALELDAPARGVVAKALGIHAIKKLRFTGALTPSGKNDWSLVAALGATVVQDCVVSLAPVTTRLDEPVQRRYLSKMPELTAEDEEVPEDDTLEQLASVIDLGFVMQEALVLMLPLYPRATGAALGDGAGSHQVAAPGETPLTDESVRPFASLASLRDKLAKDS
jgi:uncharacterized metal-binding protein YceD (DUF177 family)